MKKLFTVSLIVVLSVILNAQTVVTPSSRIVFDQPAPSVDAATGYAYKWYEGTTSGPLTGFCVGTASPFLCSFTFPVFSPGQHTITFTAADPLVAGTESDKSTPLTFIYIANKTSTPQNPRIQ